MVDAGDVLEALLEAAGAARAVGHCWSDPRGAAPTGRDIDRVRKRISVFLENLPDDATVMDIRDALGEPLSDED